MKVEQQVIDKMMEYTKKGKRGELGGLLIGTKYTDGDYDVEDAIILKQHRSYSGFAIDDDALNDFTKNATDKELEHVIGWWHSHVDMDVFYSPDDTETFKRLARFFSRNACVGVVVNLKQNQHWRVMVLTKGNTFVDIDNVIPIIEKPFEPVVINTSDYDDKIIDDFQTGMFAHSDAYDMCEACGGGGAVKAKNCPTCKVLTITTRYCQKCNKVVKEANRKKHKKHNVFEAMKDILYDYPNGYDESQFDDRKDFF